MTTPLLQDNSKLNCLKECPRKYYYRHVLCWAPNGKKSAALAFGSAWHAAMDAVWSQLDLAPNLPVDEVVDTAMKAFGNSWTEDGYPMEDSEPFGISMSDLEPRTPFNAMEMLFNYIDRRRDLMDKAELLYIERPFIVPLSADLSTLYIGKLDKTIRFEGGISVVEHKTTSMYSKASGIRPSFLDSFSPNSQVDGYLHALKMLHGEEAKSVLVDVALVHKHVHDAFAIQPVRKVKSAMDEFIADAQYWIGQVQRFTEEGYWPKNTNSCWNYNMVCPYADLCKGRDFNKIQEDYEPRYEGQVPGEDEQWHTPEPLPGYKIEVWDPVEELKVNLDCLEDYIVTDKE